MPKFLITGGAGNVGSEIAKKIASYPENILVIVDNLLTGNINKVPKSIHNNIKFINNVVRISNLFLFCDGNLLLT